MLGPPTSRPPQYADWLGIDFANRTLPDEALVTLRSIEPNATVWRWVRDFDDAKTMDPFEGRPDSSNPAVSDIDGQ